MIQYQRRSKVINKNQLLKSSESTALCENYENFAIQVFSVTVKVDSFIKREGLTLFFQMINCTRDFVTGAMEQWGLITYRETSLLFDSVNGATSSKQSKTSTISHEYVHQWFGNLMTCNWWDNIWIQEGPATYYKVS